MKRLFQFNLISQPDRYIEKTSSAIRHRLGKRMQVKMLVLGIFIALFPYSSVFSNRLAITIAPGGVNQAAQTITFDLSWDNSWRVENTAATSKNWDAAWVFVKFRDCSSTLMTQFTHGLISTTLGDHNFNVLSSSTPFEPTLADGSAVGIDPSPHNTGAMLRNFNNPVITPTTISARVTLKVTNMPTSSSTQGLDVRVYGIEMVYVPQGTYYLGDGNGTNKSYQSFASGSGGSTSATITSETGVTVYESTTLLGNTLALGDNFPKGFKAFYVMKYEIMQGQYTDFLNASTSLVKSMHYTSNSTGNRYTITNSSPPGTYTTSRPYRACNFLSWADLGTYLDWAALRPLTELEYEKACKGTAPVSPYDNAMGVAFATRAVNIAGPENGTETISVPGGANICASGSIAFGGSGDGGQGPLRGGIFANAGTSSRNQTGASFYGAMELSGNVDEYYISSLSGATANGGVSSSGLVQGDGILDDITGHFNNFGWPNPLFPGNMIIHRGGHWNTTNVTGGSTSGQTYLNVSDRQGGIATTRISTAGGRGGRSVSGTATSYSNPLVMTYTGSMQYFTVPIGVTYLTVNAKGAKGGGTGGSLGASITGTFAVTPGEVIQVLVGQAGTNSTGNTATGGGGGGSYVIRSPFNTTASILLIAGGGGGISGTPGSATTTASGTGAGTAGGGGTSASCSGGGGGFTGNGANGGCGGGQGKSFTNGSAGGPAGSSGGAGGFGGGAGSEWSCCGTGGGGGGYNGGGYSGGGGSYNGGFSQTNTAGGGPSGNGTVTISW